MTKTITILLLATSTSTTYNNNNYNNNSRLEVVFTPSLTNYPLNYFNAIIQETYLCGTKTGNIHMDKHA